MKKDKEYPATHSMSTAWYMVDDEGNVGIMDYEDNGPVPYGIEECLFVDDLIFGYDDGVKDIVKFELTDEQVKAFLKDSCNPYQYEWYGDCLIKIDTTKIERFEELCANNTKENFSTCYCVSKNMGVYYIDPWRCVKDYANQVIEGVLKTMLDENIILEVYDFVEKDSFSYEEINFKYDYPYYIYSQPYNPELLQRRVFVPTNPVKISQIPKHFRERIHRIKGSFKDLETIQIAQRYQCKLYGWEFSYVIDGVIYELIPLENGNKGYVKTDILEYPFKDYCPDSDNPLCNGACWCKCYRESDVALDNAMPTILFVVSPCSEDKYKYLKQVDFVSQNLCMKSYIDAVPNLDKRAEGLLTIEYLSEIFGKAKGYLENIVEYMNPYVIITDENAFEVLKQTYGISNGEIKINNLTYPIYNIDEINENKEKIIQLANQEYRGKTSPMVITQEEMQELEKENIAIKIRD